MNVQVGQLPIGNLGYKAASFQAWDAAIYQQNAGNDADWSGLYIAEVEATAKGYLPDYAGDNGDGVGYIHRASLTQELQLITCLDESFKRGDIDMPALKQAIRDKGIQVADDELLIPKLGQLGYCFRCYNNEEGAIEVIVPNSLAQHIAMNAIQRCTIKQYEVQSCQAIQFN